MTVGKSWGIAALISVALWLVFGYAYGDFVLGGSIVPEKGVTIDDWLSAYYLTIGVSVLVALGGNIIWWFIGKNFSGGAGITMEYYLVWVLTLIGGLIAAFGFMEPAVEGNGISMFLAIFLAPIGFYLDSVVASADAVKFIPPLRG